MININRDSEAIFTLTIDQKDRPLNVINENFLVTLESMVEEIVKDADAKGLILTSSRPEFIVGADLALISNVTDASQCMELTHRMHSILRALEKWDKPVVAAINGTALGGGFEICLACNYRIAINHTNTQIGLPEVKLGLLPGGGGTQRLPRMIGIEAALPLLMQGRTLNPQKALKSGLIDELAKDSSELNEKARKFILENPEIHAPWDQKKFKMPGGPVQSPRGYQVIPGATAMLNQKTHGNYPAPLNILKAIYEGCQVQFDTALDIEARYFTQLVLSKEAKLMMRSLFYHLNECNKLEDRPDVPKSHIQKIGILGAGMMGAGIAYASAKAGLQVVLKDISLEVAEKGKAYTQKVMAPLVEKGKVTTEQLEQTLKRIIPTDNPSHMEGCDLVIEAVIEDRNIKAKVTQESEAVMADNAVFASNTSTLPITGLACASSRPENFIGLHFFSPVDKMPLVEIIMGEKTSQEALALCLDYCQRIGKTPIVVNDGRGFYTSRVFTTYIIEGINCLSEGIPPALIENAGKAAGMPVGPLSVADEVSIDLIYHIMKQTAEDIGAENVDEITFSTADLFVNKLGRLGRKGQKGFYDYPESGPKHLSPELTQYFPIGDNPPSLQELKERFLCIQSLESIRCLEENILTTPRDGDIGSILGWGFPAYTGGSLSYIDFRGAEALLKDAEKFLDKHGSRFSPPKLLKDLAKSGESIFQKA